ncbi:hypothetical protein F5Y17DRAFT_445923 [Xylariaceae sp. FL0594]|nr:hypothetical protein F5Y17DRAFT_445923 [Xylariaceae sp. FL0594]
MVFCHFRGKRVATKPKPTTHDLVMGLQADNIINRVNMDNIASKHARGPGKVSPVPWPPKMGMAARNPATTPSPTTTLDWPFNWQLPVEDRLNGIQNWKQWLLRWKVAIRSIGYTDEESLTALDEAKLAHLLLNNIGSEPLQLVGGLTRGTHMFAKLFQEYAIPQLVNDASLLKIGYGGQDPLGHVNTFNANGHETVLEYPDDVLVAFFLEGLISGTSSQNPVFGWAKAQQAAINLHGQTPTLSHLQDSFAKFVGAVPARKAYRGEDKLLTSPTTGNQPDKDENKIQDGEEAKKQKQKWGMEKGNQNNGTMCSGCNQGGHISCLKRDIANIIAPAA